MLISVHLKQQLDDYLELLPVVRVLRLHERVGVIRARQQGAEVAYADVLVFLDSHCECTTGNMCCRLIVCAMRNVFEDANLIVHPSVTSVVLVNDNVNTFINKQLLSCH